MRKRRPFSHNQGVTIPMTPIIDIVFLLLIYFMLASNFIQEQQFNVKLPESAKGTPRRHAALVVVVSETGSLSFNGRKTDIKGLKGLLDEVSREERDEGLEIRAQRQAPIQFVVTVMDIAKEAGIKKVMITTQQNGKALP